MKRSIICYSAMLLVLTMIANPAWTQGRGRGNAKRKPATASQAVLEVSVVFTTQERDIISGWFTTNRSGLPPGLANRESLPPGLERQLRRNGTLPPGLQKKLHPLPYALEGKLRKLPAGYSRVVIGGSIILMNGRTGVIFDVIRDIIPGDDSGVLTQRAATSVASQPAPSVASSSTREPTAPSQTLAGIPAEGARLRVRTTTTLSTKSHQAGDTFLATLEEPWVEGSRVIAPQGAQVEGRIVEADDGGRVKGVAWIAVQLVRLHTVSGHVAEIATNTLVMEANGTKAEDAAKIGVISGIGAAVGALIGGGKGAVIGAATGAAAGTGVVLATHGDPAVIASETVLDFTLQPSRQGN
ncbi:MAG: hypothetical protein O7A06_08070, partial [Acidobacteria bacterium]|nr:hypothetical protein [Acidobacteriota bacterium]